MDPVKSAELQAQLKEMRAELKERSLPGAKVTKGPPSEILPFLAEVVKKNRAELREAYSNREPPILRLNSRQDPCASPPGTAGSDRGGGEVTCMETLFSKYIVDRNIHPCQIKTYTVYN
ncbi:uncharacterized protein LOC125532190 isoform X1 [Triticum urartu]|uniref:uncharacterized protein LOC125532190 isoform X1 n=1 Tax=Triticum urartu TaxID=4572 RepID=UPI00204499B3|nr:uncharacterized protein LOC125532190 isoform X1 [Triticum urartu]